MARKGAASLREGRDGGGRPGREAGRPPVEDGDRWQRVDGSEPPPTHAGRDREDAGEDSQLTIDTGEAARELATAAGAGRGARLERRLQDGARAFSRGYYEEARRLLRPLVQEVPSVAAGRELYGLALYRLGRWRSAAKELSAFRELTGSCEQHPVLADCHRALGHHREVVRLWDELRTASPSAALVTEGRIVAAGSLADQDRLTDAIETLGGSWRFPKRASEHHLRRAYALADLYERAGDIPRARQLFGRIQGADPGFADVSQRLRALR